MSGSERCIPKEGALNSHLPIVAAARNYRPLPVKVERTDYFRVRIDRPVTPP
jgi:hypothetical protein